MTASPSMSKPPATSSSQTLKPPGWHTFLVNAAVALTGPEPSLPESLEGWQRHPEAAKVAILTILNSLESKNLYAWPDFIALDLNFDNVMRYRRALVTDLTDVLLNSTEFRKALQQRYAHRASTQLSSPPSRKATAPTNQDCQTPMFPSPPRARSTLPEPDCDLSLDVKANSLQAGKKRRAQDRIEHSSKAWYCLLALFDIDEPLGPATGRVDLEAHVQTTFDAIQEKWLAGYKHTEDWRTIQKKMEIHEHLLNMLNLEKLDKEEGGALDAEALAERICQAVRDKVQAEHKRVTSRESSLNTGPELETQSRDGDADDEGSMRTSHARSMRASPLKRILASPPPSSQQRTRRRY